MDQKDSGGGGKRRQGSNQMLLVQKAQAGDAPKGESEIRGEGRKKIFGKKRRYTKRKEKRREIGGQAQAAD